MACIQCNAHVLNTTRVSDLNAAKRCKYNHVHLSKCWLAVLSSLLSGYGFGSPITDTCTGCLAVLKLLLSQGHVERLMHGMQGSIHP